MALKTNLMTPLPARSGNRVRKAYLLIEPTQERARDPMRKKRAALVERLKAKADAADRGETVSCAEMTVDQIIAAPKAR